MTNILKLIPLMAAMLFVSAAPLQAQTRDPGAPPVNADKACPPYFYPGSRLSTVYRVETDLRASGEKLFGVFRVGGGLYTTAQRSGFYLPFLSDANFLCQGGRVYYWHTSDLLTHPLSVNPQAGLLLWLPSPSDIADAKSRNKQFSLTQVISHTAEIYVNPVYGREMPGHLLGPGKMTVTVKEYDGKKLVLEWKGSFNTYYVVHEDGGRSIKFYKGSIRPDNLSISLNVK
ncbi:MAG: hypothetical protein KatS3mg052_2965 [Candidatus Roseilinea sp.]|nr:MAG: hypothetical protein KatS3mg052_2965 [Candidatus Roseilinea sp.]